MASHLWSTQERHSLIGPLFAGAIGGFCGPYVVGALVNRGGYVTCMQVLGGLFLVEAAMMFGEFPSHYISAHSRPMSFISQRARTQSTMRALLNGDWPAMAALPADDAALRGMPGKGFGLDLGGLQLMCAVAAPQCTARATSSRRTRRASTKRWRASAR